MKNLFQLFATTLLLTVAASYANARPYGSQNFRAPAAGSYTNEISTILTSGSYFSGKACKDCDSYSYLDISGGYLRTLQGNIQVGGEARLQSVSNAYSRTGKSATLIDLVGVGVYNLDSNFQNSFYGKAGVGFYSVMKNDRSDYENKLGLFIGAGKRFPLFQSVTYTPELRLVKRGDIDFSIELTLLNFSIVW